VPAPETPPARPLPGLTACSLCSGETLGDGDPAPGGQLGRLRRLAADGVARLTLVECLDECERGDVVVARPSAPCREAGAAPTWFERLAGERATAELRGWLADGGPGASPLPEGLAGLVVRRDATEDAAAS